MFLFIIYKFIIDYIHFILLIYQTLTVILIPTLYYFIIHIK